MFWEINVCFEPENKRSRSVAARFGSSQAHGRWPWHGREGCCGWSGPDRGVERALRARPLRAATTGGLNFENSLLGEAGVSKSVSKHIYYQQWFLLTAKDLFKSSLRLERREGHISGGDGRPHLAGRPRPNHRRAGGDRRLLHPPPAPARPGLPPLAVGPRIVGNLPSTLWAARRGMRTPPRRGCRSCRPTW